MLSRKNYISIADVISKVSNSKKQLVITPEEKDGVPKNERSTVQTYIDVNKLVTALVDYFGGDNPNFDEDKFRMMAKARQDHDNSIYIKREI